MKRRVRYPMIPTRAFRRAVATVALMIAGGSSAEALTLRTPRLTPVPGGYVQCAAAATGKRPIAIVSKIVSGARRDVTDFGSSLRASTKDGFYAEEYAGSLHGNARRCRVVVHGARHKYIRASLTSFDENGVPLETVEAR